MSNIHPNMLSFEELLVTDETSLNLCSKIR